MAAALQFPFTTAQWKELERQTIIYKYIMASLPVPPHLLFPLITNFSAEFTTTNTNSGVDLYGWRYSSSSNSKDAEPGRCKRTDGKKWRCSKDVALNQKYCERHVNRGRSRSRKHVEIQPLVSKNNNKKTRLNKKLVQSIGTNHVLPNLNTDLNIKTSANRGENFVVEDKGQGIEGVEQQWANFMNQKIDDHPSLFQQQYEGEGLNQFSCSVSPAVSDVNPRNDESQFFNICPSSLILSMAMAADNIMDEEIEKIQELGCDYRNKDTNFLTTHSWIPGGGPLAEMLHTGVVGATPSNPGSPYTGNGDSISPLATNISSPSGFRSSGVQDRELFTQSDNKFCNVVFPPMAPTEFAPFQLLN